MNENFSFITGRTTKVGDQKIMLMVIMLKNDLTEGVIEAIIAKNEKYFLVGFDELKAFHEQYPNVRHQITALGSIGPHPYSGHPTITAEGKVISLRLPVANLIWSSGTKILIGQK